MLSALRLPVSSLRLLALRPPRVGPRRAGLGVLKKLTASSIAFSVVYGVLNAALLFSTDRVVTKRFASWKEFEEFTKEAPGGAMKYFRSKEGLAARSKLPLWKSISYNYFSDVPLLISVRGVRLPRPVLGSSKP